MKNRNIIVTAKDHAKLMDLVASGKVFNTRDLAEFRALERELQRAKIVAPEKLPADVITLYSQAELLDLDADEKMAFTLVLPDEADTLKNKISILAPIGTGMLGYRVGDEFKQTTPHGVLRLKVLQVRYQPEAALALGAEDATEPAAA